MADKVTTDKFWNEDGMRLRTQVLHIALMIERKAREAVRNIVSSDEAFVAITEGWEFNRRIEFLTGLGALTTDEKGKFTRFQKVRNKMIHDFDAKSLTATYQILKLDPNDELLNLYDVKPGPLEQQLSEAFQYLIDDIGNLLLKIEKHVREHIIKNSRTNDAIKGFEAAYLTLPDVAVELQKRLHDHFGKGGKMTASEVLDIPREMMDMLRVEGKKNFDAMLLERYRVDISKVKYQDAEDPEK